MHQSLTNPLEQLLPDLKDEHAQSYRELILCRFCHAAITTRRAELEIDRHHQHRFINPSGVQYLIGCFTLAPGCDITGSATNEYSWFKGFSWQLARCSDCGEHLGWFYQQAESTQFFGLIVEKLVRYQS
jgi:hypothetical protein